MITLQPTEMESTLKVDIHGKVTEEDINKFEEVFLRKKEETGNVDMLLNIEEWEGMTFKGIMEDLKMTKHVRNFNKIAVVSDKKWVEFGAEVENLMPGVNVEHFKKEEKSKAMEWLSA